MKCGIIGLPNVGKSTLFNSLTSLKAPAENFPFCTIKPNVGRVSVPDSRLKELSIIFQSEKLIPSSIEFVDIAGLIPGAHKGEGLGNRFLSHIREVDMLIHVVRVFEDTDITHVQGAPNPVRDIQLIETELLLADIESLEKKKQKCIKQLKGDSSKELKIQIQLIEKLLKLISDEEKPARFYTQKKEEEKCFDSLHLLTAKPCLYVLNMEESRLSHCEDIQNSIQNQYKGQTLPICASFEAQIAEIDSLSEKQVFLADLNLSEPGLHRLIKSSYQLLNLITFFTAGKKETRAWTILKGSTAPQGAGKIHSDFQKGFICAQVYSFENIKNYSSEKILKEKGLYRQEGKEYQIQDGDVILFRFNV